MKTSISLDDKLIKSIDDYRAEARPIPSFSRAITDLIKKALEDKKEVPKEASTEIPKEALKLEALTMHIREPQEGRGGSSVINLPYNKVLEHGLKNEDKIDTWIVKL